MRSGFCSRDDTQHARCRMDACSCPQHDQDVRDKAAALVDPTISTSDAPLSIGAAVDLIGVASADLATAALVLPSDAADSLRVLYALRQSLGRIRDVEAALVQHIYLTGDHGDVRVDGLPPAKVQRGRDRKEWDPRGAVFAYIDAKLTETGEVPEPSAVADWVMEVLPANASTSCKVTALRSVGLDPKDWCVESPGRLTVTFHE